MNDAAAHTVSSSSAMSAEPMRVSRLPIFADPSAILQIRDCSSRALFEHPEIVLAYLDDADLAARPDST